MSSSAPETLLDYYIAASLAIESALESLDADLKGCTPSMIVSALQCRGLYITPESPVGTATRVPMSIRRSVATGQFHGGDGNRFDLPGETP